MEHGVVDEDLGAEVADGVRVDGERAQMHVGHARGLWQHQMALQLAVLSDLRVGRIRRERRSRVGAVSEGKLDGRDAGERAKYTSREHAGHQRRREAPVHKHEQQFGSAEERVRRRVPRTFWAAVFACRGRFGSGLLRCDRLDRARCAAAAPRSAAASVKLGEELDQLWDESPQKTKSPY